MKKKSKRLKSRDDLRPEYDFGKLSGAVRGKYAKRYAAGTNIFVLSPEVAAHFPSQKSVESALKSIIRLRRLSRSKARP